MTIDNISKYDTVIITGGEPMLFPEKIVNFMDNFEFQKFILYTASIGNKNKWLREVIYHPLLVGITFTIHDQKGFDDFRFLIKEVKLMIEHTDKNMSLRVNIFASDVQMKPIDMSGWNVKFIEWIKDCPLPPTEDFGILVKPWVKRKF